VFSLFLLSGAAAALSESRPPGPGALGRRPGAAGLDSAGFGASGETGALEARTPGVFLPVVTGYTEAARAVSSGLLQCAHGNALNRLIAPQHKIMERNT
jgi:hypothetical protein